MNLTTIEGATNFLCALVINTPTTDAGYVVETTADLAEGELALVDDRNVVLDAVHAPAATAVKFVTKRKGVLRYSDLITKGNINFYSGKSYVAPSTQVSYIGYNGTSGSMDAATGTDYKVKVIDISGERLFPTKDMVQLGFYTSTAATQENVATGVYNSLVDNSVYGEPFTLISLIGDGTGTAIAAGNTVKVSEGSKTIIVEHASAAINPSVGSYLRFGGTAKNLPIYKVASVGGTSTSRIITLESKYTGATANLTPASVSTVGSISNYGIKLETVSRSYFKPGVSSNLTFAFELGLTGFTTATVTNAIAATSGSGTYKQMAELEWYHEGHFGNTHRDEGILDEYTMQYMTSPSQTSGYEQLNIGFYDAGHHTAIGQNPKSMKHLIVAFANDLSIGDTANTAILAMDAFANTSNGFAASGISA